jgi:hypothetical protein
MPFGQQPNAEHLYNWQQFPALLPTAREGVLDRLADVKLFLSENNPEAAAGLAAALVVVVGGLRPTRPSVPSTSDPAVVEILPPSFG